ncbi:MAG: Rab geranylgeranyltransferase [Alectoria sarmentosa]|nr:MAG: Rab geranylgeranyltransferase [Alectoria sarmentosa]
MASHGVIRGSGVQPATDQDRRREQQKIKDYKGLIDSVNDRIREHQFTNETLELTSKLLKWNPEYYTIWNHRRLILRHQFEQENLQRPEEADIVKSEAVVNIISDDLAFLVPLLRKFPKCYWIWDYRLWLLEESTRLLPAQQARGFWQQELALAGKMLSLDSRNFLGWGYRRTIVSNLKSTALQIEPSSTDLVGQEFEYTTKMINSNLSNFSAWHNRSKLIPRLLDKRKADHGARRQLLDEELTLIERALWAGSEDQSLWFYHQCLMCTFDPKYAAESMVPDLTASERLMYVRDEIVKVQAMLDGAEDCKWIYQSLISLSILYHKFDIVKGNAFEAERVEHLDVLLGPVTEGDDSDVNGDGFPSMKRVRLHEVLDNFRFRENLINYAYDESFFHVIHVLGRSIEKPNDRIVCLVRQGFTTQKLWDRGRTARHKTVHGGSSSWDLDLDEINARVQEVEDRRLCLETLRRRPQPS